MKKFLILTVTTIIFSACLFAEKDLKLSVEPVFGIRKGQYNEFVYEKKGSDPYEKLSELNWETQPAYYLGGKTDISYKIFNLSFSAAGFFPGCTGLMKDSDWEYTLETKHTVKNKYSESDNNIKSGYYIQANASTFFTPFYWWKIGPSCSFNYEFIKFSGTSFKKWYSDAGTSCTAAKPVIYSQYNDKPVIKFERSTISTWLGAETVFTPLKQLYISFGGYFSPFAQTNSVDYHILTGSDYFDSINFCFEAWKIKSEISYNFIKPLSAKISVEYTEFSENKNGKDTAKSKNSDYFTASENAKSGASSSYWDFSFALTYRIF